MLAVARKHVADHVTRAANDDFINSGPSTRTKYLYDGINPLIIGGTLMMASGNLDEIFAQVGSSGTVSYLHDGTNSTVALTSGSGNVTANDYYSPYGDTATTGSGTTAFQYTGRENDAATGLYYNRARYYSPQLGRFISEDPLQIAAGTNFYAYANGNPTSLTDPLGLFPPSIPGGVANSVTGFGDTVYRLITLGIGDLGVVRNFMGIDGGIDVCSSAYRAGKYAGWAWGVGFVWVGGLAGAPNPVFWAGRAARADALATGNTINDTLIGGVLAGAGVENQLVWRLASVTYAANATGYATVYVGATEASSIWAWEQAVLYARGIAIHGVF